MLKHCNRRRCFSDSDGKTILDEVPPSLNRWRSDGAQSCSCGSGPATCWTLVELSTHDATFVGVKPSRLSTIFVGLKKKMIFLCFVLCCHDRLYCLKKWDKMEHICFETDKSNVHVPNPRNCNYEHVTEVISVSACVCVCVSASEWNFQPLNFRTGWNLKSRAFQGAISAEPNRLHQLGQDGNERAAARWLRGWRQRPISTDPFLFLLYYDHVH